MSRLVAIVGNSGAGKTSLVRRLAQARPFATALEDHAGRPFQAAFASGQSAAALPNQVDYLLYRAEQEQALRRSPLTGLVDGGLDMDFQVFTRRFYARGDLDAAGFALCGRLYGLLRQLLPPPDLIVWLQAPLEVVAARHRARGRRIEAAGLADLADMDHLLHAWLDAPGPVPILRLDASREDPELTILIGQVMERIKLDGIGE